MSRRSLGFSFKLSRLDKFLMPGAGGTGKGGSNAPPKEEPLSVASGEKTIPQEKI
jgi:hypothetical protein